MTAQIRAGALVMAAVGLGLLAWQWYEVTEGTGLTLLMGGGLPVPIAVPGVLLLITALWRLVLPHGLNLAGASLVIDLGTVCFVLGVLYFVGKGAAPATRVGMISSAMTGLFVCIVMVTAPDEQFPPGGRPNPTSAFLGGLILFVLPLALLGAGVGSFVNLLATNRRVPSLLQRILEPERPAWIAWVPPVSLSLTGLVFATPAILMVRTLLHERAKARREAHAAARGEGNARKGDPSRGR